MGWQSSVVQVFEAGFTVIQDPNGLRVYNGIPTLGNLISSVAQAQFTDDFGNLVLQGTTTYSHQFAPISHWIAQNQIGNILQWMSAGTEAGPWTQVSAIQYKEPPSQSTANFGLTLAGDLAFAGVDANNNGRVVLLNSYLHENDPNAVAAVETWHTLALSGSWAAVTGQTPQYKLMADQTVQLVGQAVVPAGVTGPANTIGVVNSKYVPVRSQGLPVVDTLAASPFTATAHNMTVRATSGNVDLFGAATAGNILTLNGRYPLD